MSATKALLDTRDFLLAAYRTLPNVLFVTALLLGAATGFLPLVLLALGMLANAAVVGGLQFLLGMWAPCWSQVVQVASEACTVLPRLQLQRLDALAAPYAVVAPSHYVAAVAFFGVYVIYDAARVLARPARPGAEPEKVDRRTALTVGAMAVAGLFLLLALGRFGSGCESVLGVLLGAAVGTGMAVGWWHLMDACHDGEMPDVLQVVTAMAPPGTSGKASDAPVMCTPTAAT